MAAQKFDWRIDAEHYLRGDADKIKTKDFIEHIAKALNDFRKYDFEQIKTLKHNHLCCDLKFKKSAQAKRLNKHFEKLSTELGEKEEFLLEQGDLVTTNILQLFIKGFPNCAEFRCYGYIRDNCFYLIYLDPKHEVYKE